MKVFLIHGINLKPERMNELGRSIARPFEVIALPGHKGDSTRGISKEDLLDYVDRKVDTDDCAIIGFSLGGLIAIKLSFHRTFRKVSLIAPAIYPKCLKLHLPVSRVLSLSRIPIMTLAPPYYSQNRFVYPDLFKALFELASDVYKSDSRIESNGRAFFHPKDRLVDVKRSSIWIESHTNWKVDFVEPFPCLFNHMLITERSYKGFPNLASRISDFLDS